MAVEPSEPSELIHCDSCAASGRALWKIHGSTRMVCGSCLASGYDLMLGFLRESAAAHLPHRHRAQQILHALGEEP
jgi:hypothetical protein